MQHGTSRSPTEGATVSTITNHTTDTITEPAASIQCPSWCTADHADHKHGEWVHHGETLDADDVRVQAFSSEELAATAPADSGGLFVDVSCDQCLTPDQARGLASAIVQAASMVEDLA